MPMSGCVWSLNVCVCLVYNHLMCHARVWMCLIIECLCVFILQPFDVSCPCLDVFVHWMPACVYSTTIGRVLPVSGCVCSLTACVGLVYNHLMCHARVWMCLFIECLRVFSLQPLDVSCPCLDVFDHWMPVCVYSTTIGCVMPVSGCVWSLNACVCLVYNHWMCHARVWMCLFIECLCVFSLHPFDVSCPCLDVFVHWMPACV